MPRDRLADLLAMTAKPPVKPIAWYGLAMEYRSRGQREQALEAFESCIRTDEGYVPAYFQSGMTLDELGRRADAVARLKAGLEVARRKGDGHAAGEMGAQLEMWEND